MTRRHFRSETDVIAPPSDNLAARNTLAFCRRLRDAKDRTEKPASLDASASKPSNADRMGRYNPLYFDLTRQAVLGRPWHHESFDFLQTVAALTFLVHFCDGSRAFRDQDGWFAWGQAGDSSTEASTFAAAQPTTKTDCLT